MGLKHTKYSGIEDYVAHEYSTEPKHEYENGQILMMSGGPIAHGILCGNAYNELRKGLEKKNKNCRVIGSEVRIHIKKAESIVYPDAMVICGDLEISDEDKDAVINPVLVIEVLSKTTESYDRGDKFHKYRQIDVLREYILINQEKAVVETFYKKEDNIWEISRTSGLDQEVAIKSMDLKIEMKELYVGVSIS